ncbi:predicted protein [Chaetoceros tenuissimus]|uniref:Uncharacterized protein n=1 Tax=Chaetoceros tenuissimus TaxID=426638 RepID=A0AAD3D2Q1_9STRA|nr:predicted protein [Chaetoceros tenuissimus]
MNCLQYKVAKAESFLPKLKALIDIAENHLYDEKLLASLEDAMVKITDMDEAVVAPLVGEALFSLHESRPPVEIVEKLLEMFPMALNVRNSDGLFPIQFAIDTVRNSKLYCNYMHLFVNRSCVGQLHKTLRGDEKRGTTIQILTFSFLLQNDYILEVIDYFCKQGFITKEDIDNFNLLTRSCHKQCKERFECLARWHKEALKTSRVEDKPLLYNLLSEENFDSVEVFLQVSFQLFPDESGLLFFGDYSEQDHVHMYQDILGFSFYETLEKVIRPISFPLLHQMCKRSEGVRLRLPFKNNLPFLRKLLDEDGRNYNQALFAHCNYYTLGRQTRVGNIAIEELETKDPVTGLLPFVTIAANNGSVGFIYDLLLKHPSALLNCIESSGGQKEKPMSLKRKRDDSN